MGAGAIGCYVGGRLLAARAADVVFVGRPALRDELRARGLGVAEFGGAADVVPGGALAFETEPDALAGCDVVCVCVKSAHTDGVARALAGVLAPDAIVASLQNGVRNADALRAHLGARRVLAGIVGFNVVQRDAVFRRTTSGPLIVERCDDPRWRAAAAALAASGQQVIERPDIAPDQWTKLLVNLNNAISALSGAPTRDLIASPGYRRVLAAVLGEGIRVLRAAGIRPARLRGVPVRLMVPVLRLPTPMFRLVARAQFKIDPEARSSMWEDLARGRPTEVDYLNGEVVALAARAGADAPLNRRIVALVHEAEAAGRGSPGLDPAALWSALCDRQKR
jgi:2-dehydropantoate 2-reductase